MITEHDKAKIKDISQKYHASRVVLFGSSLEPEKKSGDIDIAVDGVAPQDFFTYCGELMFALSKPVDVVDLSSDSKFIQLILKEGQLIYG